ncbi:MAG: hypothetical protein K0U78_16275 [Actinomycetia bacterium]|nr:hypothetical protein [Actinomycetes bacterium]
MRVHQRAGVARPAARTPAPVRATPKLRAVVTLDLPFCRFEGCQRRSKANGFCGKHQLSFDMCIWLCHAMHRALWWHDVPAGTRNGLVARGCIRRTFRRGAPSRVRVTPRGVDAHARCAFCEGRHAGHGGDEGDGQRPPDEDVGGGGTGCV